MAQIDSNKYIRTQDGFYVWPTSFGTLWHKHMAQFVASTTGKNIISAGFVYSDDEGKLICHGHSESLSINSKPEDTDLINEQFNLYE